MPTFDTSFDVPGNRTVGDGVVCGRVYLNSTFFDVKKAAAGCGATRFEFNKNVYVLVGDKWKKQIIRRNKKAKIIKSDDTTGPYPGKTWEQQAFEDGFDPMQSLFSYLVTAKIDPPLICDNPECKKPLSVNVHFCCQECFESYWEQSSQDAQAEARSS